MPCFFLLFWNIVLQDLGGRFPKSRHNLATLCAATQYTCRTAKKQAIKENQGCRTSRSLVLVLLPLLEFLLDLTWVRIFWTYTIHKLLLLQANLCTEIIFQILLEYFETCIRFHNLPSQYKFSSVCWLYYIFNSIDEITYICNSNRFSYWSFKWTPLKLSKEFVHSLILYF